MAEVMRVLVTGAEGFIGKNLVLALSRQKEFEVIGIDLSSKAGALEAGLQKADVVVHLAGVNRPKDQAEFAIGNAGFTQDLINILLKQGRATPILFASSTQAALDNPYGKSKRQAELALGRYAEQAAARVLLYRFPNVFGKWCRPNYNSALATFCHNIARDLPITVTDAAHQLELIYIDDLVALLVDALASDETAPGSFQAEISPTYKISLGDLVTRIRAFRDSRATLLLPDVSDPLTQKLYTTYLSYLDHDDFAYDLTLHSDDRGHLAELLKSPSFGQIFVSKTRPGVTRGNHYHDSKVEKFCVLSGQAVIRFRHVLSGQVLNYSIDGNDARIVDIPPGYTHSIENVGDTEMLVLFWASEIFNPDAADTFFTPVLKD